HRPQPNGDAGRQQQANKKNNNQARRAAASGVLQIGQQGFHNGSPLRDQRAGVQAAAPTSARNSHRFSFGTKPHAPFLQAAACMASSLCLVTMMTRASGCAARSSRVAVNPSIPAISTSINTQSVAPK